MFRNLLATTFHVPRQPVSDVSSGRERLQLRMGRSRALPEELVRPAGGLPDRDQGGERCRGGGEGSEWTNRLQGRDLKWLLPSNFYFIIGRVFSPHTSTFSCANQPRLLSQYPSFYFIN